MSSVVWFRDLRLEHIPQVGGKNASLGEMLSQLTPLGIRIPDGFATTADAFRTFLAHHQLDKLIDVTLRDLDVDCIESLTEAGARLRQAISGVPFHPELEQAIDEAWQIWTQQHPEHELKVAVRSSATAEDLPDASFAGQQESFLHIQGLSEVKRAIKEVFASLFNDRAIAYRVHRGFAHSDVAISAGVQQMVWSDDAVSGVMFTLDTESGFRDVVLVNASYGLGETIVQGAVNPDEFYVYKPNLLAARPAVLRKTMGSKKIKMISSQEYRAGASVQTVDVPPADQKRFCLSEDEIEALARDALAIETHYGCPMDIEWAKDGHDGHFYILQARPETVQSQKHKQECLRKYRLKNRSKVLITGRAIGQKIGQGVVRVVRRVSEMDRVRSGDILVTDMTDPDWEPVMKRAAAIVTNRGGRTCHAAIIARELGIPAVVGCGHATDTLKEGQMVTVSCAEGDTGEILEGTLDIEITDVSFKEMPDIPVKIMMNVANPDLAFEFGQIPHEGVGLARLEFIINRQIGIHPQALLSYEQQPKEVQQEIEQRISGYEGPRDFYIKKLSEGIATIAAAFAPKRVIVRLSDFKTNEYAYLVGGDVYEEHEENPMMGFRGASRYVSEAFRPCFDMECLAVRRVREDMGLHNVDIMIPFVRTTSEAQQVLAVLAENGLERGDDFRILMMCELPSNAVLADEFLEYFDGFSIGSNDMTQLTLGVDRDSGGSVAHVFDERNAAVKAMLSMAIQACRKKGKYVGICGQGPSDYPDFAQWLMQEGIDTISLNPDSVVETWLGLAAQ